MLFPLKAFILFGVLIVYAQCDTHEETTISVATLLAEPFVMLRDDTTLTGNERFEGYIIDLLDLIGKKLGFKYEVHLVPDNRYGHLVDGEWNGIIGQVRSGRAQIGAAPITITSEREAAADFTIPFMSLGISILYKRPSDGKALPFTNVEELAALETTKFGCKSGGSTLQFFARSDNPTYKQIYERMIKAEPSTLVQTNDEGIERVKAEDYAFFMESNTLDYIVQRDCDLQQVGGLLNSLGYGLVVEEGSPMRVKLSAAIIELQQSGDLVSLKEKWWLKRNGEKCHQ
ncbi:glutamate receptor ionotropic, kainate 1-like [Bradysia coprophila]|uniref:glutamate receptor ionotropic, kainate 1-like n=1 Tax=Bradysia coprophila TaxID=38358 RepID=UPI00187D8047|nr:glutamate receptor ionotropic, kainate 1-like [Bradysia coprophila]